MGPGTTSNRIVPVGWEWPGGRSVDVNEAVYAEAATQSGDTPETPDRLGQGAEVRLTLVSAPAGFGKTTLLAEWFGQAPGDRSVAWLSLDSADNDPVTFWTYVVTALRTAVRAVGSRALKLLAGSPVSAELVLTTVLNELAAAPHDVWLVLDDYHLVDNAEIRARWGSCWRTCPPICTW